MKKFEKNKLKVLLYLNSSKDKVVKLDFIVDDMILSSIVNMDILQNRYKAFVINYNLDG